MFENPLPIFLLLHSMLSHLFCVVRFSILLLTMATFPVVLLVAFLLAWHLSHPYLRLEILLW